MFARSFRKIFFRQSLTVKLVITFSIIFFSLVAIGTVLLLTITHKAIAETSIASSLYQTQMLKMKLLETMLNQNEQHDELQNVLAEYRLNPEMGEVNIFNPEGEIRFSTVPQKVGQVMTFQPGSQARFTPDHAYTELDDSLEGHLRVIHPIHGSESCLQCHSAAKGNLLGGLELSVPLRPIYERIALNRSVFVFIALGILGIGFMVIRWLVSRIVRRPLKKLMFVMGKARAGALEVRAPLMEDPDLHQLEESFNLMVQGLQTAQKNLESQHQKEMKQANRLMSIGQMISNVSHEIKNPLASISSTLHALRNEFEAMSGTDIYQELNRQTERIQKTVDNLLRYAKQTPPQFVKCSLVDAVHHALHYAEPFFVSKEIRIQFECTVKKPIIWADAGHLEQIFLNLFLNAGRAMGNEGILKVTIREGLPGKTYAVDVEDNGSGINPDILPKIFDPFFTTHAEGSGLGLSVVKSLVQIQNGSIHVESQFGAGTQFTVIFPMDTETKLDAGEQNPLLKEPL